nr:MAG TPA: hypothetical protein [Caudoviricetes sp.]
MQVQLHTPDWTAYFPCTTNWRMPPCELTPRRSTATPA